MSRGKEFTKNTILLFIGKFATQFISFFLLPLYTRYLITTDYGYVDLIQTYISLFVPILILKIDSSVFRFLLDNRKDQKGKEKVITNSLFILFITTLITIIIAFILSYFIKIKYFTYLLINIIVLMISSVFLQILRGLGKNLEYSIASFITGTSTLLINILLIIKFKFDASSILISSSIANIICIIYIAFIIKIYKSINIKEINKKSIKKSLAYSIPMIPNSLSWWIVNVSDRTIISLFLGTAINGIYSISCKFSNILNNVFQVFNMSWQETASLHINDDDKEKFFSNIIDKLLFIFASISLFIIVILPFIFNIVIGNDYIISYNYIPILLYSNSWNVLIGLIGGIYVAKKQTKQIANTTIISAIINLIVHFILINFIGLYAACVSTLVSYIALGIYRYIDCKKLVNIKISIKKGIIFTIIYILSSIAYSINNIYINILNLIIASIYIIYINKDVITIIPNILKSKIKKKRKFKNYLKFLYLSK